MLKYKGKDIKLRPNFFIVGAPRCGTTSMIRYLGQHPDVFIPNKELHFFDNDVHYDKKLTEKEYLDYFSKAKDEKRVGEKSPSYLRSKRAASEIRRFCPRAKIIIQVRNPVDMLYSWHGHVYRSGYEDIVDFEEALAAEEDRKRGSRIPKHARIPEHLFYSEIPLYTEQIKRYVETFGWNQIHVIVFDDLVSNPLKVYRDVLRFLEVDDQFVPNFKVYNSNRLLKSMIVRNLMRNSWVQGAAKVLLPRVTYYSIGHTILHWNTKVRSPMDKKVRKRLQKQFAPEVKRLSKLLGRDLTHWCKD